MTSGKNIEGAASGAKCDVLAVRATERRRSRTILVVLERLVPNVAKVLPHSVQVLIFEGVTGDVAG